jgi:hypothetical protein
MLTNLDLANIFAKIINELNKPSSRPTHSLYT